MANGKESPSLQRQLQAVLDLVLIRTKEDPQRRLSMVDVTKELKRIERFIPRLIIIYLDSFMYYYVIINLN